MLTLDSFQKHQGDLIQTAIENTPPQALTKSEELWRTISIPSLDEIVRYPAICLNKNLQKNTIIKPDENGRFCEYLDTPDGLLNLDLDSIHWTVGGRGKPKHDTSFFSRLVSCGEDSEHYTVGTARHCTRPSCAACYSYTIRHDVDRQAQRVLSMAKIVKARGGWKMGRKLHATISVPPELYYKLLSWDGYQWIKDNVLKIAQSCGIVGGIYIFHPYRQNGVNDEDDLGEDYTPTQTNDGDKHSSRFAPHFHIVGFGWIENTPEIYAKSGWIVKNIRTGKNTIKTQTDIEALLVYLRSHAGVIDELSPSQPRYRTINYFGACGPRVMSIVDYLDRYRAEICPECGAPLMLYDVHGRNNDISPHGPLIHRDRYPIFALRGSPDLKKFIRENSGSPADIVRYLDSRPDLGACAIDYREFVHQSAPWQVQTLDGALHTVPYEWVVIHKSTKSEQKPTKQSLNHDENKTINGANTKQSLPAPIDGGYGDYFVDYHYPPIPEGVF